MSCSHSNNKQRRAARASRASGRLQKIIRPSAFAAACSSGLVSEGDDDPSSNKRHRHRREAVVTWRRETATAPRAAGRLRRPRRPRRPRLPGRAGAPRPLDRRRRNEPRFPHAGFIIEDRRHRPARSVRASVSSEHRTSIGARAEGSGRAPRASPAPCHWSAAASSASQPSRSPAQSHLRGAPSEPPRTASPPPGTWPSTCLARHVIGAVR